MSSPSKQPPDERFLISAAEAAELLSISPRTLWTLTQSGEISTVRIGRRVMYSPSVLRRWVRERSTGGKNASN
ncbi:helix-turn-helix domain-containing protein [Bremerella sp.]|uniref:helix-turn-helix domain-containing protein n=1 Tax=Bremerella sp. TaxID=2795602 RepID=UPI00391BDFD9